MHWIYLAIFLICYGSSNSALNLSKRKRREAESDLDFTENLKLIAEVDRLKRTYPENERLLANIPSRIFEVIYPVQVRHQQKLGISTRDTTANRTGKHFHQTQLLIKAFHYRFRLDLELNDYLLSPKLVQKHLIPSGIWQLSSQEIEHCFYHGTTKDYPEAVAAFRTCSGISGIIHVGNETFVVHPFYGGDLSRTHPHVIYKYFNDHKSSYSCGNSKLHEWGFKHYRVDKTRIQPRTDKRDIREVYKFLELGLVLDQAMFDARNTTRAEVVNDAIQIINCVDMYFRTINTRVSIVYIETWATGDQMDPNSDIRQTLLNFAEYAARNLFKQPMDTTHLITGRRFASGEVGMGIPDTVCTTRAAGVSRDTNIYEPHLVASTVTHVLGHNMGMTHDVKEKCQCSDWWGCIMAPGILGTNHIQPYHFSTCSLLEYINALRVGHGICLFNKPGALEDFRTCGNGKIDDGEDCDCGNIQECAKIDPCCDPITCQLRVEAECSTGPCCENCKLKPRHYLCRTPESECDIPEYCDGRDGNCPTDIYKKNGLACKQGTAYCYLGKCRRPAEQCEYIWGFGAMESQRECFEQFNMQGSLSGNCGSSGKGEYIKCTKENMMCGSLQCQRGARSPIVAGMEKQFTRTIVSMGGAEYECKVSAGSLSPELPDIGIVWDGTKCDEEKICINKTCVSVDLYRESGDCPSNNVALTCSGHGVCSNINTCYCNEGFTSSDCSQRVNGSFGPAKPTVSVERTTAGSATKSNATDTKKTKITSYVARKDALSTPSLVIVLVSVVGGVFIFFALLATCYRRSTMPKLEPSHMKKHLTRKTPPTLTGMKKDEEAAALDNANRIITFGSMPSYREDKLQELKRKQELHMRDAMSSEDGEETELTDETSTFIELSPNNLSRVPEKGILKHPVGRPEKWADEAALLDCSAEQRTGDTLTEVERTLKSLNGYHEEILEALHSASSHRPTDLHQSPGQESQRMFAEGLPDFGGLLKSSTEQLGASGDETDEIVPPCGPIRIRNLEDLLRQLEQPAQHVSPAGSDDLRLSEPEADRHYHLDRPDSTSATESQYEPGLRYLLGRRAAAGRAIAAHHTSETSPYATLTRQPDDDDEDDEEGSADEDGDEGGAYTSPHLLRSASEEALPVTGKPDYTYDRNLNTKQQSDKGVKRDSSNLYPSPPSEESGSNSYEENSSYPPIPPPSLGLRGERSSQAVPVPLIPGPPGSQAGPPGTKRKMSPRDHQHRRKFYQ